MNGLEINISEQDFKNRDPADRDWMLYQGISVINQQGCKWGKTGHSFGFGRLLYMTGAGVGAGFGVSWGLWKLLCGAGG